MASRNRPSRLIGRSGTTKRRTRSREIRKSFLLVTEGKKTEPNYFRAFNREVLVTIETVSVGAGPTRAVERAKKERNQSRRSGTQYDEVWCIFDLDQIPPDEFNRAIQDAQSNEIEVAYSVPCFELWYLIHFQDVVSQTNCKTCLQKLDKHLGGTYHKNDKDMYAKLRSRQKQAMARAKSLEQRWKSGHTSLAKQNPSTRVHELVARLLANQRP